jgi:hypothetical protein
MKINIHPNCTYTAYKTSNITENKVHVHPKDQPVNAVSEHNRYELRESYETQTCCVTHCRVVNKRRNGGGQRMVNWLRMCKVLEKPDTM